jgi:hypothetical protein
MAKSAAGETRFRQTTLVAGLLHALLLLALSRVPSPARPALPSEPALPSPIEVALAPAVSTAEPTNSEEPQPGGRPRPDGGQIAPPSLALGDGHETRTQASELDPSSEGDRAGDRRARATGPSRPGAPAPMLSLDQLGIGDRGLYRVVPTPRQPTAQERLQHALNQALLDHDRARGMGVPGPVVTALENAAGLGLAPIKGQALFVARVDETGKLSALDVLECAGDREAWTKVGQRAAGALGTRRFGIPKRARGLELRIRVTSRDAMPSGADPGLAIGLGGATVKQGAGRKSARLDLLRPRLGIKTVKVPMPGKEIEMVAPDIGIDLLSSNYDPSDIGARSQRVVHAQVLEQRVVE